MLFKVERTGIEPVTSGLQKRSGHVPRTASLKENSDERGNAAVDGPQTTAVDR
jgi:hypothetical protein